LFLQVPLNLEPLSAEKGARAKEIEKHPKKSQATLFGGRIPMILRKPKVMLSFT